MARQKGNGTTITCTVSGKGRPTTWIYLRNKAQRLNVTCTDLKKFYICREVITQLNKGADVFDIANPDCEATLRELLQEKSIDEMVALNSRSKKNNKRKHVTADVDTDTGVDTDTEVDTEIVQVEKVQIDQPLSDETEQYLARKAELLGGQDVVDEIHKKVWGEDEVEEEEGEVVTA